MAHTMVHGLPIPITERVIIIYKLGSMSKVTPVAILTSIINLPQYCASSYAQ